MISKPVLVAAAIVGLVMLAGCNSPSVRRSGGTVENGPALPGSEIRSEIRRMDVATARTALASGEAVMVDVRDYKAYADGHIRDAEPIALEEIAARSGGLPKDRTIILYCSCPAEEASRSAAKLLKRLGIENTAVLVGGYPAWKKAGYPVWEPPD